jgi:hypothetical protein
MAYNFAVAHIAKTLSGLALPLSLACKVRMTNSADGLVHGILKVGDLTGATSQEKYHGLTLNSTAHLVAESSDASNWVQSTSAAAIADSNWHHIGGAFASAASRTAYLDGVAATVDTNSRTPPINEGVIGSNFNNNGTFNQNTGHSVEWAACWNIALAAKDFASMSAGLPPYKVRPDALVFCVKLYDGMQGMLGSPWTNTSATQVSGAPVYEVAA